MEDVTKLSDIFKALSNPQRLSIYRTICEKTFCCFGDSRDCDDNAKYNCSVGTISGSFDLAPATVSHHLKELKYAGLIHMERKGKYIYLTPMEEPLGIIGNFIEEIKTLEET